MTSTRRMAAACAVAFTLLSASARAQESEEQIVSPFPEQAPPHQVLLHPHREQRDAYIWGTFGPPGLIEGALTAAFQQWRDSPREWGQTESGYFKRFGAEYAEGVVSNTTKYAIARLRDEDPSFRVCECSGVHRRLKHALISPFIASTPDGRTVFSFARLVGTTTSTVVSSAAWKPTPQTPQGQLKHIGVDLLGAVGVDILREFFLHHKPS